LIALHGKYLAAAETLQGWEAFADRHHAIVVGRKAALGDTAPRHTDLGWNPKVLADRIFAVIYLNSVEFRRYSRSLWISRILCQEKSLTEFSFREGL
jgi:hypothetical protein